MLDEKELADMKEQCDSATKGWVETEESVVSPNGGQTGKFWTDHSSIMSKKENRTFAVAARNDVPKLIDAVEQLCEKNERLNQVYQDVQGPASRIVNGWKRQSGRADNLVMVPLAWIDQLERALWGMDAPDRPPVSNGVKTFEIWEEGYRVTGDGGPAVHLGSANGKDFRSACINFFKEKESKDFDADDLTVWGCRLFDNETDARKMFG